MERLTAPNREPRSLKAVFPRRTSMLSDLYFSYAMSFRDVSGSHICVHPVFRFHTSRPRDFPGRSNATRTRYTVTNQHILTPSGGLPSNQILIPPRSDDWMPPQKKVEDAEQRFSNVDQGFPEFYNRPYMGDHFMPYDSAFTGHWLKGLDGLTFQHRSSPGILGSRNRGHPLPVGTLSAELSLDHAPTTVMPLRRHV